MQISRIDVGRLGSALDVTHAGPTCTTQVWMLLAPFLPPSTSITSDDLRNIRTRPMKYRFDKRLTNEDISKILEFKPLDSNGNLISEEIDILKEETTQYLCLLLQNTSECWKTIQFLEKVKNNTELFDYHICTDPESGTAIGV